MNKRTIFLNESDCELFDQIESSADDKEIKEKARHLILKLCSAVWRLDRCDGVLVSEYINEAEPKYDLARYLAKKAGFEIEDQISTQEVWMNSLFSYMGFNDFNPDKKGTVIYEMINGQVMINGQRIKIDPDDVQKQKDDEKRPWDIEEKIFDYYDTDSNIVFDMILFEACGRKILVIPRDTHRRNGRLEMAERVK
jgi:hypothetical protein